MARAALQLSTVSQGFHREGHPYRAHEHAPGRLAAPLPLLPQGLPESQQQDGPREEEPPRPLHQGIRG